MTHGGLWLFGVCLVIGVALGGVGVRAWIRHLSGWRYRGRPLRFLAPYVPAGQRAVHLRSEHAEQASAGEAQP